MPAPNRSWLLWPVLLAAVALAYQPAWQGGLLWDDAGHITPAAFRSLHGLWRIWSDPGFTQQYYPFAHSVFLLQSVLWGDEVLGYHLVNLALHATSAFLIVRILRRLAIPGATLAALIFALHPVHVESVAWISELKNTLSTTSYLAAALVYLRFDRQRRARHYAAALILFGLALLSKSVTATLPAALLVVFWWRRGRLRWRDDVVPLTPFFGLGIAAGLITVWLEQHVTGARGAEFDLTIVERMLIAGRAVWFYLVKLVFPARLTFIYPRWEIDPAVWWQYLYPLALFAAIAGLWLLRRRSRAPLAAALVFFGTLFPALGFFNVYPFRFSFVADHFQYLASIPIIVLFAAAVVLGLRRLKADRALVRGAITGVIAIPLAVLTWTQSRHYASEWTLYRATLANNPDAWLAHNNLARLLMNAGRSEEAREHVTEAVRLNPNVAEHHMNMGQLLLAEGAVRDGVEHLTTAVRLNPGDADAHSNLGVGLLRIGRAEEAIEHFQAALRLDPAHALASANLASAHMALGVARAQADRLDDAVAHFTQVVALRPDDADAHFNLANALHASGRLEEAVTHYRTALGYNPRDPLIQHNLELAEQELAGVR